MDCEGNNDPNQSCRLRSNQIMGNHYSIQMIFPAYPAYAQRVQLMAETSASVPHSEPNVHITTFLTTHHINKDLIKASAVMNMHAQTYPFP